jgi:elongation factor Ts
VLQCCYADKTAGVVITLNCETDFVGMNESFVKMATEMANQALNFDTKEIFLASVSTESLLLIN